MTVPPEPGATPAIDPLEFRSVLGHFATGVTVLTGQSDGQPVGLAANAFTSVSLDPPLVLVCPARSSATWPLIRASGAFAVNFLAEHQEDLSRRFGARDIDRFADTGWHTRTTGSPVFPDALAYLDCLIEAEYEAGDHWISVGRVVELGRLAEGKPLIFWRGSYGRLAD